MRLKNFRKPFAIILIALIFSSCKKTPRCYDDHNPSVKVFATGLNNPRGLKFGPDGHLYVAEAGMGGTNSSIGQCLQVFPAGGGPYTGSLTSGRISKINEWGVRTTVTDQLPSAQSTFGDIVGVGDVAFIGNSLYALVTGGGCSHANPSVPNSIVKVANDGSWSMVANLSGWLQTHPVKYPPLADLEPDGNWYSMDDAYGDLYAVEANQGQLVKITTGGNISRVIDFSANEGHIVPTSVKFHHGKFFVGNLNTFPISEGSSNIYKVTAGGDLKVWASGFTTVLGVAFDKEDRLYVLENTTGNLFPTPGTGKVIRVDQSGNKETIVSGLNLPTAITIGHDGKLYVSNRGFGPGAIGGGEVLQINLKNCDDEDVQVEKSNFKQ